MANPPPAERSAAAPSVPLRDPLLAAFLAWLLPGLGHWYQGRLHKAAVFAVCILTTFFFGLYLGEGRVVYASFTRQDNRLFYLCQVWVGLPALPALVQMKRFQDPAVREQAEANLRAGTPRLSDWFMAPPNTGMPNERFPDELDSIYYRMNRYFELGTIFTAIAGLLNVLAIYDAFGGPVYGDVVPGRDRRKEDDPDSNAERPSS